MDWTDLIIEWLLPAAVLSSSLVTIIILTLPPPYTPSHVPCWTRDDFSDHDQEHADRSGFTHFQRHHDARGRYRPSCAVQVVVLGDVGRSPRMQYHAMSIAAHGGHVNVIGYVETDVHPALRAHRFVDITPLRPFPKPLHSRHKVLFLLLGPLKVLWQTWSLYHAIMYRSPAAQWMLVQNPPSMPTLFVAQLCCLVRKTRLIIDWHNFAYSILALRLGGRHPFVWMAKWYEGIVSRGADFHFAVTSAMTKCLRRQWGVEATVLHDRPPAHFQPLSHEQRSALLYRLPETAVYASAIEEGSRRLIVSSTSWTADEDFSIFLDALVDYSSAAQDTPFLPQILAIITGQGPQKELYQSRIRQLNRDSKLHNVVVLTAWLSADDYASLLGSADLGVSLHTSSSGVDLPMKVVDMFGAGLPVAGWSAFEAWPELVHEGVNGRGFDRAEQLSSILQELFEGEGRHLARLREGALKECERRWNDEWMPVAGKLLKLES